MIRRILLFGIGFGLTLISIGQFLGDEVSLTAGMIKGLLFGIIMEIVLRRNRKVSQLNPEEGEVLLYKSNASHNSKKIKDKTRASAG